MFISKKELDSIKGQLECRWEYQLAANRKFDYFEQRIDGLKTIVNDLVCFVDQMGYKYNPNGMYNRLPMFEKKEKKNGR